MVVAQIFRAVASTKVLLVPTVLFTLGGGGLFLISYEGSRYFSAKALGVRSDNSKTTTRSSCIGFSTLTATLPVMGFLLIRHRKYNPPSLSESWMQIKQQVMSKQFTMNHLQSELTTHTTTTPSGIKTIVQPLSRTEALKQIISRPIRFYSYNVFASAAILGIGTSCAQRAICGKTKLKPELQKGDK